jgi:pyruvate/2-oxoglutarate dehydrogenase complex dihydrolipoamide acyltransferase (E2) component
MMYWQLWLIPEKWTGGKPLFSREERKEKMSLLRKTISKRLVEAKNTTAMLTTFNEARHEPHHGHSQQAQKKNLKRYIILD